MTNAATNKRSLRDELKIVSPAAGWVIAAVILVWLSAFVFMMLTGAGLGGCIVALGPSDLAPHILNELEANYYRPRGLTRSIQDDLLVAEPTDAARVERY